MSTTILHLEGASDAELISAVRDGDTAAYGQLFERHVDAARRLARQLVSAADVDDVVSEAFAKVLVVLRRGGGPDLAFRAYLLTSVRRLQVDRIRSGARLQPTDDLDTLDSGQPFEDTAVAGFENAAAARAFASLPERWQQVLWHTEVEGQKPADVALLLGMSPNSVSALAYRAREGLRQAFISMHAQDAVEDVCATTRAGLGSYIRNGSSRREAAKIEEHLGGCMACSAIYLELTEVNDNLGALLGPLVLGAAAAGYLGGAHAGLLAGAGAWLGNLRNWVIADPIGKGVAGVAVTSTVAVAGVVGFAAVSDDEPGPPRAAAPAATAPAQPGPTQGSSPDESDPAIPEPTGAGPTGAGPTGAGSNPVTVVDTAASSVATAVPTTPADPNPTTPSSDPGTPGNSVPVIGFSETTIDGSASEPVTIDVTAGASDADGDTVSVKAARVLPIAHGTVRVDTSSARTMPGAPPRVTTASTITYTAQPGWRGTDAVEYVLTDGHGGEVTGQFKIRTPNADPTAGDDTVAVHSCWIGPCTPTVVDVLANDSDLNGDSVMIVQAGPAGGDAGGSVAVDGGQVVYTPAPRAPDSGGDLEDRFGYRISDGHAGTASATVTVRVGQFPNQAPVAQTVSVSTHWTRPTTVAPDASDPDGDPLMLAATDGKHGSVAIRGTDMVFTPTGAWSGTDTFTYTVSDGTQSVTATATVHLTNTAPQEVTDTSTITDTESYQVDLPTVDSDGDPLRLVSTTGAVVSGNHLTWTPPYGVDSAQTITWTLSDGVAESTSRVQVTALMPRSSLTLSRHHVDVFGAYQANRLSVAGIPSGRSVRVSLDIVGARNWANYFWTEPDVISCPSRPAIGPDQEVHVTCVLTGNGDFMHIDFVAHPPWSMDVRLEAIDFAAPDATLHVGS